MKKRHLVAFGLVTIVAALFYAGVWTCESNTLSQCFMLTGFVALGHALIRCLRAHWLIFKQKDYGKDNI